MTESPTPETVATAFEQFDGIDAQTDHLPTNHDLLVKVRDEAAIGKFFKVCREMDVTRERTTRGDLAGTVLDSWVDLSEE